MKPFWMILISGMLSGGCASQPTPAFVEPKTHCQTNARHPSNLYAEGNHHDSYMWYRPDSSRNNLAPSANGSSQTSEYYGGGKLGAHGGAGPPEAPGGRGGNYGPQIYYGPGSWY